MYKKKGQKGEFLDLNTYFVAEFSLEELEVLPPLLNEKSFCPKTLREPFKNVLAEFVR